MRTEKKIEDNIQAIMSGDVPLPPYMKGYLAALEWVLEKPIRMGEALRQLNIKLPMFVVVDSNNQWLAYGEFDNPDAAYEEAKLATKYDGEAKIHVYRIESEKVFDPEDVKP